MYITMIAYPQHNVLYYISMCSYLLNTFVIYFSFVPYAMVKADMQEIKQNNFTTTRKIAIFYNICSVYINFLGNLLKMSCLHFIRRIQV